MSTATGSDPWSLRVDEVWVVHTKAAIASFDRLALAQTGVASRQSPRIVVASTAERAKAAHEAGPTDIVVTVTPTASVFASYEQTVVLPVRARALALQQLLAGGNAGRTPLWLREGLADYMAHQVLDDLKLEIRSTDREAGQTYAMRNTKDLLTPQQWMTGERGVEKRAGAGAMASLMVERLAAASGSRFASAWPAYFRLAAAPEFQPDAAFEKSFGLAPAVFLAQFETWLTALKTEQRQHAKPVPDASNYADIQDASRFPLKSSDMAARYKDYLSRRAPKALAISSRGALGAAYDSPDAMERALTLCRAGDSVSCQLYAVDDRVVYQPAELDAAGVEVVMASHDASDWTQQVGARWQPLVQQATESYNRVLKERAGVALNETVRVYLASSSKDYEQVLREQMKLPSGHANDVATLSGGVSNLRGQIAIPFQETTAADVLRERALKTSLHELTHELQGQLSQRRANGVAPQWIMEGTADLLAYNALSASSVAGAAEFSKEGWRNKCLEWFYRDGYKVGPEDVFTTSGADWLKFVSAKRGPYLISDLMAMHLESLLGDRFYAAWVAYFRQIGQPKPDEQAAFKQNFGLSHAEFLTSFKQAMKAL
ncbi:MAG TPA: hypothetical protein VLC92_02945 [Rhodocyclaceae bacterium]|nr:hypothetical protein [Rhodocyclaceae bacterium]